MNLWESYEHLPPLSRITTLWTIIILLMIFVYRCNNFIQNRIKTAPADPDHRIINVHIENGVKYIRIAYWRYIMIAIILSIMIYVLTNGLLTLNQYRQITIWQSWSKDTILMLVTVIVILILVISILKILISGYKAVQLEVGIDYIKFRKNIPRAGILLSNKYISVNYSEITEMSISYTAFGGGVISVKTARNTYSIYLLLSTTEKAACYQLLCNSFNAAQNDKADKRYHY